ncbi:unnamed protein product [Arabidopsis halleri]
MASSVVSSMFLFLLLLFVFPHIDNVLGARMELRELEEINHADPQGFRPIPIPSRFRPKPRVPTIPPGFFTPRPSVPRAPYRPKRCPFCKPPPPPKAFPSNTP